MSGFFIYGIAFPPVDLPYAKRGGRVCGRNCTTRIRPVPQPAHHNDCPCGKMYYGITWPRSDAAVESIPMVMITAPSSLILQNSLQNEGTLMLTQQS